MYLKCRRQVYFTNSAGPDSSSSWSLMVAAFSFKCQYRVGPAQNVDPHHTVANCVFCCFLLCTPFPLYDDFPSPVLLPFLATRWLIIALRVGKCRFRQVDTRPHDRRIRTVYFIPVIGIKLPVLFSSGSVQMEGY